jgi:hypothetical protein
MEDKIMWFELMDAKDAFEVMHLEWRLIVDKLMEMKLDGRLSSELFTEIVKDEQEYLNQRLPNSLRKLLSI